VIDQITRALDMSAVIVKGIADDHLGAPSLCPGWTVRVELNHLVGGMRIFAAELSGTDAGAAHEDDWLGADHRAAYTTAADLDRAAWQRPGAMAGSVRLGFGVLPAPMAALVHLTEVLVHGADLALVTGQERLVDDEACGRLLATMRGMSFDDFRRPGMFGPAAPVSADAPDHRRLLAFLGRDLGAR